MKFKNILDVPRQYIKSQYTKVIMIFFVELFICLLIYSLGGAKYAFAHLMYVPIIYSAKEFKLYGGVISGLVSGLLLSGYFPYDVVTSTQQLPLTWIFRLASFVVIGGVSGYFFKRGQKWSTTTDLILSNVSDAICVVDKEGRVTYQNQEFLKYVLSADYFKKTQTKTMVGMHISDLYDSITNISTLNSIRILNDSVLDGARLHDYYIPLSFDDIEVRVQHNVDPIVYENEYVGSVVTIKDFKNKENYERTINTLQYTDGLTGLKNRSYLDEYTKSLSEQSLPQGYLIADINSLKFINDSFGHMKGDEFILKVAYILSTVVGIKGEKIRLDGDEFIAVIPNATHDIMDDLINRIQEEVKTYTINHLEMNVSCGYYIRETSKISVDEAVTQAESNMYLEKNSMNNPLKNNAVNVIINTLHEKDNYSEQHSNSVSKISKKLATACKLPRNQVTEIWNAALLHDIGKIIVPLEILHKEGRLTSDEFSQMKEHPEIGYRLLNQMNGMGDIGKIVLSHHERWDGKGYPKGIKKQEIPLASRIISVADSFDAITSDRPYRKSQCDQAALKELMNCSGTQFDPDIIKVFKDNFDSIITNSI